MYKLITFIKNTLNSDLFINGDSFLSSAGFAEILCGDRDIKCESLLNLDLTYNEKSILFDSYSKGYLY